jgi:hypothetical protein
MSKSQNRKMRNEIRQGNMIFQKVNIKDLVESEYSFAEVRRMIKKCLRSLERTYQSNSMKHKRIQVKNWKYTERAT